MKFNILHIALVLGFFACRGPQNARHVDVLPHIYPDYVDVTIPVNIAPLNFMMRDSVEQMQVEISGVNGSITVDGSNKIDIPLRKWKTLLQNNINKQIQIQVLAKLGGQWEKYRPFKWTVKADSIDPYLSYRLIEPGYEVWNKIQLAERHLETFRENVIADNNLAEGSCMNCHIYGNQNGSLSMFHLRGKKGGTILNQHGKLRKLMLRNQSMISPAIYGNFHPSGRYAVFSTNIIIPELHAYRNNRLEVYDTASDLVVVDFDKNETFSNPVLTDTTTLETFPVFSADGKWIYYCGAPALKLPQQVKQLKYSICRVSFDAQTGTIGEQVDTLWNARTMNGSVCHLKTSPNGRYLLYSVANYGTFPIWHREADLQLIDLQTSAIDSLKNVNGPNSDSYHSWSSNSRWFVFASKRDDGIYGKPYFCYIDSTGKTAKPFVLPQHDPSFYDYTLKSFNLPDLSKTPVPFDAMDIEKAYWNLTSETVTPRTPNNNHPRNEKIYN